MEIQHLIDQNASQQCTNCHKNRNLIQKYQKLIRLLKKKTQRSLKQPQQSLNSICNKFSNGDKTTSHSLINSPKQIIDNKYLIVLLLNRLQFKVKNKVFQKIIVYNSILNYSKANNFVNILNKVSKIRIKQSFQFIKINNITNLKLNNININNNNNISQSLQQDQQHNSKSILYNLQKCPSSLINLTKNLYKKIFCLQKSNQIYKQKIKKIQLQMQQSLARQIKQNRKKTQSLQMVAQQMMEKNQIITELQQKINMLQQRYHYQSNGMLEDQITMAKNQIKILQKTIIKLQTDNKNYNQIIKQLQIKLNNINTHLQKIQTNHNNIKIENLYLQQKVNLYQNKEQQFQRIFKNINSILQRLIIKQKSIQSCYRKLSLIQNKYYKINDKQILIYNDTNYVQPKIKNQLILNNIKYYQQEYKIQLIFTYLYNITQQNYMFCQYSHKFDKEQLLVLQNYKQTFKQMKDKIKSLQQQIDLNNQNYHPQTIDLMQPIYNKNYQIKQTKIINHKARLSQQNQNYQIKQTKDNNHRARLSQQNQNYYDIQKIDHIQCYNQIVDGSLFDIFDGPHEKSSTKIQPLLQYINPNMEQITRLSPQKNLTMKLLQLQIQKNKQIQKISQLKQKYMYIRNILFNLLKSLEIKNYTEKKQAIGIVQLIFDVFQYSEEEKQAIFNMGQSKSQKNKKIFGVW